MAGAAFMALVLVWWRAWSELVARGTAAVCVAGVVLSDIHDLLHSYTSFTYNCLTIIDPPPSPLSFLPDSLPRTASTPVCNYWSGIIRSFNYGFQKEHSALFLFKHLSNVAGPAPAPFQQQQQEALFFRCFLHLVSLRFTFSFF